MTRHSWQEWDREPNRGEIVYRVIAWALVILSVGISVTIGTIIVGFLIAVLEQAPS